MPRWTRRLVERQASDVGENERLPLVDQSGIPPRQATFGTTAGTPMSASAAA